MLEASQLDQSKEEEQPKTREQILAENLSQYRSILAKVQHDSPTCLDQMPGFTPDELAEREKTIVEDMPKISYSKRYHDSKYEYRHVILPKGVARWVPPNRLMTDAEWRSLGVVQSPGWIHYMIHEPEPHVLLFKREKEPPKKEEQK